MFLTLLAVTFAIAALTSVAVAMLFRNSARRILDRIVALDLSGAWSLYLSFAIGVVGISGGVRIWELERYATPRGISEQILELNRDRWILEIYRTLIGTLQSCAWLLLVFFLVALIAYVIVRGFELRRGARPNPGNEPARS